MTQSLIDKMFSLDGQNRDKIIVAVCLYLGINLGIAFAYCYAITPQWH